MQGKSLFLNRAISRTADWQCRFAALVANVRAALGHVARIAEQFPKLDRWRELLRYICARITASTPLQRTSIAAIATG
jgi:hypothetical protein